MANPRGNPLYHFTPEQITDMAARHRAGVASNHMARDFGCSGQTITRVLKLHGHWDSSQRYRSRNNADQKQAMVDRYAAGESLAQIAKDYDCTPANVRYILLKRGVELRRTGRPSVPAETMDWIREQRESGASFKTMAAELGVSDTHVASLCRRMGLMPLPRERGSRHHAWKGGRYLHGSGYIYTYVDSADPLYCMATAMGYVAEHRLVMARNLGRPLRADETVHHLDGDTTNNLFTNLQLRQGRHGKGVVMTCHDCDSANVRASGIADLSL